MPLENEGGDGSRGAHWERRLLGNEYMTASDNEIMRISEITMALFEDSGWYRVNYSMAEGLSWGKN
jgi:Leishmanolysin